MNRTEVTSSFIKSIGYDPDTKTCHIEFKDGKVFEYPDADPEDHAALVGAESVGKHFHSTFKTKYKGTLLP